MWSVVAVQVAMVKPKIDPNSLVVGRTRVRDNDGFLGTVVYVGPVASAKNRDEIYAGIEWDDNTRGKHDGSVICRVTNQFVRHFKTTKGSGGGSFVRLSKLDLGEVLDLGIMKGRYVQQDAPVIAPNNILEGCFARTTRGNEKQIELLGEMNIRKRQQLQDLKEISLRNLAIANVVKSPSVELIELGESFTQIDLAGNLLCDWTQVQKIFDLFPNAKKISLASNRLNDFISLETEWKPTQYTNIQVLNLNGCGLKSIQTILHIVKSMPNLQELCLANNQISDLHPTKEKEDYTDSFPELTLLDLSGCKLTSWENEISQAFQKLPRLKTLILDHNDIPFSTTIDTNDINITDSFFSKLEVLQIASNAISEWSFIDFLNMKIPTLKSLRFRNNPLTQNMGSRESRAIIIARLEHLNYLNASPISEKERVESERMYVRNIARELLLLSNGSTNDSDYNKDSKEEEKKTYLKNHPRFETLVKKHSEAMSGIQSSSNSNSSSSTNLSSDAVNITLRSMASSSCTIPPITKRLPSSLKINRLKSLCQRLFQVEVELQTLHLHQKGEASLPMELEDDENTLGYYGVTDNSEILVNEIDVDFERKQKEKERQEFEKRFREQGESGNLIKGIQERDRMAYATAAAAGTNS